MDFFDLAESRNLKRRSFLFLQGPPSPFYARLALALQSRGQVASKIALCGGDLLKCVRMRFIEYRGNAEVWSSFFLSQIELLGVTDVILFGDCRPAHRDAVKVCSGNGITVHVFEEGYLRPGWVSMEQGGVNGFSSLPRIPSTFRDLASGLSFTQDPDVKPYSFWRRALRDVADGLATTVLSRRYPGYRHHRPLPPIKEGLGWLRRIRNRSNDRFRTKKSIRALNGIPFFMFPLQLETDSQIVFHLQFDGGMDQALDIIMSSFAAYAPLNVALAIKTHPLHNGLRDWGEIVQCGAKRHEISDRVFLLEMGDIAEIGRRSLGMVTVNSTSATFALRDGVPVFVLGKAIYDMECLTHQGSMGDFWRNPELPDPSLFHDFRKVLIEQVLLPGSYFTDEGIGLIVDAAIERLGVEGAIENFSVPGITSSLVTAAAV